MHISRRSLLKSAAAGSVAGGISGCVWWQREPKGPDSPPSAGRFSHQDMERVAQQPVLKLDSLKEPVIVESVELLRNGKTFLLRTRSKAGVEAITVPNSSR